MEGCNDWHCDQCGWFCGNGVVEMRMNSSDPNQNRFVKRNKDTGEFIIFPGWDGFLVDRPGFDTPRTPITTHKLHVFQPGDVYTAQIPHKYVFGSPVVDIYFSTQEGDTTSTLLLKEVTINTDFVSVSDYG